MSTTKTCIVVGQASWNLDLSASSNATTRPTTAADGINVPDFRHNEYSHITCDTNGPVSLEVLGRMTVPTSGTVLWSRLELFHKTDTAAWSEPLTGATAYEAIATRRVDTNTSSTATTYIGFCAG